MGCTINDLAAFRAWLLQEERSAATVEKYLRDVRQFAAWLDGAALDKAACAEWKDRLAAAGYGPGTVNGKLSALNSFLRFLGREDCRVRFLRRQRRLFREEGRILTAAEYGRLLSAARGAGKERLALLMETVCAAGIRVSEVRYITVEAARAGRAEVALKGKVRTILLPEKLCRKLCRYARKCRIASGEIFLTRGGASLSRKQIWAEMKALCRRAGVQATKVFPHNLRHLFARTFYRATRDLVRLADVLGHSSVETTRIYLISTGAEHAKTINSLRLVS